MLGAPGQELLVPGEYRVDDLVEHVVGGLTEEMRIGEQCLVRLAIQPDTATHDVLATRTWFDQRHNPSCAFQIPLTSPAGVVALTAAKLAAEHRGDLRW